MAKHIGIVGCSAEGAALCYQTICLESEKYMGAHFHPEVSMHTHSLGKYLTPIDTGDWNAVAELMLSSAEKLDKIGVDFLICPDNTIHEAFPYIQKQSDYLWLHIAEVVAKEAQKNGFRKLAILGTKYLMEGPVYPEILDKLEIEYQIPSKQIRLKINDKIFNELVNGIFIEKTRLFFNDVIREMKSDGCNATILGCTEIPLIVDPGDCPLPVLDSTRLLARAAIDYACA